jgi:hypothetical protein
MAEGTALSAGSLQQFLNVTQDHLWCLFAVSFMLALSTAIFLAELEGGRMEIPHSGGLLLVNK